jgi:biotin carboxyl carrier protein
VQSAFHAQELVERPRFAIPGVDDISGGQVAPMPGAVLAINVTAGDEVGKGDLLIILEAMKMEHRITAPFAGTVDTVHIDVGDQVENGQLLVTITDEEA